jgi:hypothetical protein
MALRGCNSKAPNIEAVRQRTRYRRRAGPFRTARQFVPPEQASHKAVPAPDGRQKDNINVHIAEGYGNCPDVAGARPGYCGANERPS